MLRAAVELADQGGLASLSMRRLARQLGVEAMSLGLDLILDGLEGKRSAG